MAINNDYIADQFSFLAKLMDIHGENSFKIKSYSVAAFTIEKLPSSLLDLPPERWTSIKGIGDAIGKKIQQIITNGELPLLREYINKTPPGVIGLLRIKGLGPKKIATIWKEMEIEDMGELLYACQENRLLLYKGFGEKTQNSVREAIEFIFKSQGSHLFSEIEGYANGIHDKLKERFGPGELLQLTGEFRRQLEIIDELQWVTTIEAALLQEFLESIGFTAETIPSDNSTIDPHPASVPSHILQRSQFRGPEKLPLSFLHTTHAAFINTLFETSASGEFLAAFQQAGKGPDPTRSYVTEEEVFAAADINFIPPYLREQKSVLAAAAKGPLPAVIQPQDIRAIIHSHSTWSDGSHTLEEMAAACIERGYEYLVISDHSKSAFYAKGLDEDRIRQQHAQIDEINRQLAPFVIFKSIECDILYDGALDYADPILASFDLVIASVHSNLKMPEEKAMIRLLRAIENPYTTILGHPTGRLLLSRPGYPVDHKKIIDACAANGVVIELNAHPRRLDMDWRWIGYALEKGVLISIDPDAHSTNGYKDVRYGTLAAQKGGLTPDKNLSSFTLPQFRQYLAERKKNKGIS